MNPAGCSLDADELAEQLERYRAIGRLAAAVEQEAGRVVVRFADDPPSALIERTLEVERSCCPFLEIDYDPGTQSLAIGVADPDRRPGLDTIVRALKDPGVTSCCGPTALETCCEPQDKPGCCGQPSGAGITAAPSRCGCRT